MPHHNLDDPGPYAPKSLGDHLDTLRLDLRETRAALEMVGRDARQWQARAKFYRERLVVYAGPTAVHLHERDAPELFPGLQEHLDRSA